MLPSSVRRVAPTAAGLAASAAPRAAVAAAASTPVIMRGHQRRFSSSKPSRPDNGSSEFSAGQSVPASSSRHEGKASGDKRKRKSKEAAARDASFKKLPSVPATHHMSQEALGLSSFFSLHRPISITQTMPRTVSDEHFASIFAARSKASRMSETISTLSDTIDQLEGPMAQMTIGGQEEQMQNGMQRLEVRNADGSESSVYLQVDTMSGDFLPFRPPPLPQAQTAAGEGETSMAAEAEAAEENPQHRVYKAMFTIEESTEADGQIRIVAHSPRIINEEQPRSFIERLAQRQLRFDESRARRANGHAAGETMEAISVKRQRKLRMKKKKYKKFMKRTRNLRRKLDRT
ncbi:hypothetical protein LMH87_005999 [Akanthomyces muscarius]|uniref:Small ribosomal subunit protein mS38 n=2 Tax=Akanthomyces TaxID=150366 RepID=A0A168KHS9_CORDF|nr:hypothetical protein LMH87_005999 [Akanthomyces muscarius]KAJ4164322.1 hypothetical protein LMH87_005999 [Akanthomyces muscarius]OAA81713.1 hypothetical protein LEL_01258 [Akanthomyces lecanii RCEF 1005]